MLHQPADRREQLPARVVRTRVTLGIVARALEVLVEGLQGEEAEFRRIAEVAFEALRGVEPGALGRESWWRGGDGGGGEGSGEERFCDEAVVVVVVDAGPDILPSETRAAGAGLVVLDERGAVAEEEVAVSARVLAAHVFAVDLALFEVLVWSLAEEGIGP